ncbi:MAG: hypothetical protein AAF685_01735 [Cyanobacteria bacterium P01_C01_bin.89]
MPKFILFLLLVGYFVGAWKFWTGFKRTNFQQNRIGLTLMWPVLFLINKPFRTNFQRALKG